MNTFTALWIVWGLMFLGVEGVALFNKQAGDTLSEHVWGWLRVKDVRPTGPTVALRVVLAGFLVWLLGHLTMGWWS